MVMRDEDLVAPASNDAYTGMLSISLLALIGGCVLLYLDYSQYPDAKPPELSRVAPDKKLLDQNPIAAPKADPKALLLEPRIIAKLAPGEEITVKVSNGKAETADVDKEGLKVDVAENSLKITTIEGVMEQDYVITVKGADDKSATLKVTVKMAKGKE